MKLHFRGISAFTKHDFVKVYFTIYNTDFDTDGIVYCETAVLDENNQWDLSLPDSEGRLMEPEKFKMIYNELLNLVETTSSEWFKEKAIS